jgi:phosphoribosylanthranilate isomerase
MHDADVKICGLTNTEDARLACDLGAAMLGFNFYARSPRYIAPESAARIITTIPRKIQPIGVFVNASQEEIIVVVKLSGVRAVQLHGAEPPSFCGELRRRLPGIGVIKALHTVAAFAPEAALHCGAEIVLLDAACPEWGGSGRAADWEKARAVAQLNLRVILAGGLTAENVGEAIRMVQPHAVDVSSGVENSVGYKDAARMRAFFAAVHVARKKGDKACANSN